jgi:hypothetical protein
MKRRSAIVRGIGPQARRLPVHPVSGTTTIWYKMTRTELTIQVLKVAIGLAFGAYFVWWSLQVLDRLIPTR